MEVKFAINDMQIMRQSERRSALSAKQPNVALMRFSTREGLRNKMVPF